MVLPDGTIVPNFLSISAGDISGFERAMNDIHFKVGRVVSIHSPQSDTNTNGKFYEFDVAVDDVNHGSHTEILYPRCQLSNFFGGVADFFRWKPRLGTESTSPDGTVVSTGSRV